MTFEEWAEKWKLPPEAISELNQLSSAFSQPESDVSENAVASECRVLLGKLDIISMRNNVGVLEDRNGRPVRYGLCNESPAMNKVLKASDDILIIPHIVRPEDVGRKFGIFGAAEYKRKDWKFTGKGREVAQSNFHRMVQAKGGIGFFANNPAVIIDTLVSHRLLS